MENAQSQWNRKSVVQRTTNPKKITNIQFGTLPTEDIQKVSEVRVSSRVIFSLPNAQNPTRHPAVNGCMDPRMGISGKSNPDKCSTCLKNLQLCSGHFGYIQLELPVFHAGYFKHTLTILQCICKECCRVMIPEAERQAILRKLADPRNQPALTRAAMFKKVVDTCKSAQRCPHCSYSNGVVKKASGAFFKILHELWRAKCSDDHYDAYRKSMEVVAIAHPELKKDAMKQTELINPLRAYELLVRIPEDDLPLLWMNGAFGRPDTLIMWAIPVPPVPIRPSVPQDMGGGSTEDDITIKLQEIIEMNNALRLALDRGATMKMVVEDWEFLQIQVALFINGETPGIPRQLVGARSIRGLCQRLKGKQGRFRGNLSGKRVDFSGRTVISPDPNLRVDQVGVPVLVAKILTYPEKVHQFNINRLRAAIKNGPEKHPGANVVRTEAGMAINLTWGDKDKVASTLKIGDIVERHMHDGDIVLFNRQPSLHKMSIMAHRVKVMPWRTFRFNECACTPYNADFDGDEMNLHLPQTEEARAEAAELMLITNNLITPRNGEPLVAATQDFLTGAYVLTHRDVFFTKAEFCRLVAFLSDATEHVEIPLPSIFKPRKLWTGKQVISMLIRPNKQSVARVNLESEEKFYKGDLHFCPEDGYVAFRGGEHVSGSLGKKTLGGESKNGLFYVLVRDYGCEQATRCMSRLAKLCARYLGDRGFSIGVDDVTPTQRMKDKKQAVLAEGQRKADEEIALYESGQIKLKPGCDALQSLESEVNGLLGRIREQCGQIALGELNYKNSALAMAQCGSKGSPINISQMMACLGQQTVGGARIQDGFVNRTLPHFPVGALYPAGKGFVGNSFISGLTATEFFFHTMGGREGLVDTAVKTAETGYMARRLMKALEDLSMQYDYTVRNSEQTVVQFSYGDDGLNPQIMERGDRPVNFSRLTVNEIQRCNQASTESIAKNAMEIDGAPTNTRDDAQLTSIELISLLEEQLASPLFTSLLPLGQKFIDETREFFSALATKLASIEALAGLNNTLIGNNNLFNSSATLETASSIRERIGSMSISNKAAWEKEARKKGTQAYKDTYRLLASNVHQLSRSQLLNIIKEAVARYHAAMVQPGEAVGAVGAQSLSEPGTQMTLKTFHFAGVASMNVTLGVPRLKEIINASKVVSTPIIKAPLVQANSVLSARVVKALIEKTTLGEVSSYIREVHCASSSYISIQLDTLAIQNLHLQISASSIKHAILSAGSASTGTVKSPILRLLKPHHIQVWGTTGTRLHILAPDLKDPPSVTRAGSKSQDGGLPASKKMYFVLQALKAALPHVIVQGFPSVSRAVINEGTTDDGEKSFHLLVEGYGLREVMGCQGVDGRETVSNHIMDMQEVLGIEAARSVIASEIGFIMKCYGILVDCRHLMLLSDVMTFKGEVLGITRFGVAKMRESVLMLASFEKTTDHLFDAAVHSREDAIVGVSECIIMGTPIPIGTGIMKVMQKQEPVEVIKRTRLLDRLDP